ncbi:murein biosynthesis integral membrane protein MurJ [Opitutus terrae]|uniref:Probable lipid II flippase MurJ n=1 Tax=Opitutus terrae (strain DSM 11246 / JCM 15787 / PB90-1) TaxID=452637 RepID=B1ZZ22_OPITP|nr:murein biosynthesis integral membrane protein MurJ [Opitutus terrae]ACB77094.1 integral membrane protein MviN [Opitutus terrae PB90-1]
MASKLKHIGIVSLLTVVSRVLGLVRDQLGAAIFGASELNSAFITAFSLPNLFRRLLGEGSLTAAFVPTLQDELHERGRPGAFMLLNQVTSWLALITGALVVFAMVLFSQSRLLPGHESRWYLAADLAVILFPYLAMICIAAALNATLNVFEHFTEPALSPIWLNLAMIATLGGAGWHLATTELGQMYWLCAGVLIGGFLQLSVPAGVLVKMGWRPRFDFGLAPRVREIGALMAPGLFGTAIYQINVFVSRLFAFSIDEASATLLFYANRLMELPIGVFAIAVATVVYPLIARHATERNFAGMADDYRKGLRLILMINVPAAAGLALLSEPIVRLIYQHGEFTATDTRAMGPLLALFSVGMPFFSISSLTTRAFYALKDTVTPVKIGALSFVINVGLSWALKDWLGAPGLVLASTAAVIVQTIVMQRLLARAVPGLGFGELWRTIGKIVAATAAMSLVVFAGWAALRYAFAGNRTVDLIAIGGLIPVGVAVYAAVLWAVRVEGREEISAILARFRGKFGG